MQSCEHFATMGSKKVDQIRSGRNRHCEVHRHQWLMMSSGNTWFSSKVPFTKFKNSVGQFTQNRGPQDLTQVLARHTVAQLDIHPDRCHSFLNLLSDSLGFRPNPSSIQNLDGMEKKCSEGNNVFANFPAHEDKHCLTVLHFKHCHGARRKTAASSC